MRPFSNGSHAVKLRAPEGNRARAVEHAFLCLQLAWHILAESVLYSSPMKSFGRLIPILGLLLLAEVSLAAEVEVTPFLGYHTGGGFDTSEGDLTVDPAANFGLVLSLRTRHDGLVELLYSRQPSMLKADGLPESGDLFDLSVEYLHFGGLWEIQTDRMRPILGLSVGGTRLNPGESGIDDEWAFSAGISGGVKYFFTDRLAIRLEGRGLISFFDSSGAIFCGFPPGQCVIAVEGSSFLQIGALAGLTFRF